MKNIEIIQWVSEKTHEYLSRYLGVLQVEVTKWVYYFKLWLSRYSDGFKSIKQAIQTFTPYWNVRKSA